MAKIDDTALIACKMLENEVQSVLKDLNLEFDTFWTDRGLHDMPERLHGKVMELIGELEEKGYRKILICMGLCGNALDKIGGQKAEIVFPKCHDCIDILITEPRITDTMYLTGSWLLYDNSLPNQYKELKEKYGEKKGKKVFSILMKNYHSVTLINDGIDDTEETRKLIGPFCEEFQLSIGSSGASLQVIRDLLSGCRDERFVTVTPGTFFSAIDTML